MGGRKRMGKTLDFAGFPAPMRQSHGAGGQSVDSQHQPAHRLQALWGTFIRPANSLGILKTLVGQILLA